MFEDQCLKLESGGRTQASNVSWGFFVLLVVLYTSSFANNVGKIIGAEASKKRAIYVTAGLNAIIGALQIYVMYWHCKRCNGGMGFLWVLVLGGAHAGLHNALCPEEKNE